MRETEKIMSNFTNGLELAYQRELEELLWKPGLLLLNLISYADIYTVENLMLRQDHNRIRCRQTHLE